MKEKIQRTGKKVAKDEFVNEQVFCVRLVLDGRGVVVSCRPSTVRLRIDTKRVAEVR